MSTSTPAPFHVAIAPRLFALVSICLVACAGDDLFFMKIESPGIASPIRYSVEASVYAGDTSRVFITLTSPENQPTDPQFQRASSVSVRVGQREPVLFREVTAEDWYSQELEQDVPLTYYAHRFDEAAFEEGDTVRLLVDLPDGTRLRSLAVVPRPPTDLTADISWTRAYLGNVNVTVSYADAPGEDFYLLRAEALGFRAAEDEDGRRVEGVVDSVTSALDFYRERGLGFNYFGERFLSDDDTYDGTGGVHSFRGDILGGERRIDSTRVRFALSTINSVGYRYLRGAQRAYDQAGNILVEPAILPTNIEGGLGALIVSSPAIHVDQWLEAEY